MPHSDHSFGSPSPYNTFVDLPIFPNTVPTAPLLRISLRKLLARNSSEEERCWQACCELGFFYLDLEGDDVGAKLLKDADELFEVMKGFFNLPIEEKVKYDLKEKGSYFGYKGYGEGIVDKMGTRDKNEFYNVGFKIPESLLTVHANPLVNIFSPCPPRYRKTTS
jgi:isopenicillin N synthase-like dioxygenase